MCIRDRYNTEADGKPLFLGTAPWGNPCNCKMADFRLWSVARTAEEIKNNYQKQVEPSATGLIKNFNFAEGNGDHTANLAEPEGNQAWCMGAIDTDYSWETVAQIPTNLRTENQTENSFDICRIICQWTSCRHENQTYRKEGQFL